MHRSIGTISIELVLSRYPPFLSLDRSQSNRGRTIFVSKKKLLRRLDDAIWQVHFRLWLSQEGYEQDFEGSLQEVNKYLGLGDFVSGYLKNKRCKTLAKSARALQSYMDYRRYETIHRLCVLECFNSDGITVVSWRNPVFKISSPTKGVHLRAKPTYIPSRRSFITTLTKVM